jgi:hypothetical protein
LEYIALMLANSFHDLAVAMLVALGVKHILLFGLTGFGILGMRKIRSQYGEQD